jgi:hypothetical protein
MPETYVCGSCGGLFPLVRTEKEVADEYQTLFPEQPEEKVKLCEPCFIKLMQKAEEAGVVTKDWRKYLDKGQYPD